ncbi:myo-inositol-1(or 4)-monophosphatase [Herbaspirillum sp. Sphag1AN]|uniref:inositol monophosphatase family protein n=1 Tax=unclassified Herbaspirillum TaxID=2624150 RepID=UPI0017973BE3|nr:MULTISPECIES: inositol monophosphatase family protein [unclassified Herbaspirillum]MBB3213905.1 myo-inositol-1(or 4)-monophosphatase [Herbaspirillum sp. Sphag1AN]MBB3247102.1 myo-inositol-1(or 4)-monophosphatase [Herbaspirillum sp. Sphag64]
MSALPAKHKFYAMTTPNTLSDDAVLLQQTAQVIHRTGNMLLERFNPKARPTDLPTLLAAIDANDQAVTAYLRQQLQEIRPQAGWIEDEKANGPLPPGEWWVVDPVEGNINHIHGMYGWSVTATLVRDNRIVLTVVDEPLAARVYTALHGGGACLNGEKLQVSSKQDLRAALVSTGQATPGEDAGTLERLGSSITAMLKTTLLVKAAVPATMQLIDVAAGRIDAFWQPGNVLSGQVAGALLVREAGGIVTDWDGANWELNSPHFLATTPGVQTAIVQVLRQLA